MANFHSKVKPKFKIKSWANGTRGVNNLQEIDSRGQIHKHVLHSMPYSWKAFFKVQKYGGECKMDCAQLSAFMKLT